MITKDIEYRNNSELPRNQVINLYSQCGWSSAHKPDELLLALSNSETIVSAWHQNLLVGIGNAISDGALVVYYSHLLVLPSYQKRGIGQEIMRQLQRRYTNFHQQVLLAIDSAVPFYEKLGFSYSRGVKPMWIYKGSDITAGDGHQFVETEQSIQINYLMVRPIQFSDLDALAAIWSDPEVTQFLPNRGVPIPKEATEKALASFIEHWKNRNYGIWAIVEGTSSRMIGYCGLRYLDELDEVEILYGLAKAYWGKGIATQVAKAAISYGFDVANLDRIIAMTLPDNQASRRVLEKAGLQYEKQVHMFNLDALYYSIAR